MTVKNSNHKNESQTQLKKKKEKAGDLANDFKSTDTQVRRVIVRKRKFKLNMF